MLIANTSAFFSSKKSRAASPPRRHPLQEKGTQQLRLSAAAAAVLILLLILLLPVHASATDPPGPEDPCREPRENGYCFKHLAGFDSSFLNYMYVDFNYTASYVVRYGPSAPRSGAAPLYFSDARHHFGMRFMSSAEEDTVTHFHLQYLASDNENTTIALHAGVAADNFALSHGANASTDYGQTLWAPEIFMGNADCNNIMPNALDYVEAYDRSGHAFCAAFKLCNISTHALGSSGQQQQRLSSVYYHPYNVYLPDLITSLDEFIDDEGEPITQALCEAGIYYSGVIASQRPFVRKPTYRFAAIFDGLTAVENYFGGYFSLDESVLKNVTLSNAIGNLRSPVAGGSAQPAWRGVLSDTTLLNEVVDFAILLGDYNDTTVTPPLEHETLVVTAAIDTSTSVIGFSDPPTSTNRGHTLHQPQHNLRRQVRH